MEEKGDVHLSLPLPMIMRTAKWITREKIDQASLIIWQNRVQKVWEPHTTMTRTHGISDKKLNNWNLRKRVLYNIHTYIYTKQYFNVKIFSKSKSVVFSGYWSPWFQITQLCFLWESSVFLILKRDSYVSYESSLFLILIGTMLPWYPIWNRWFFSQNMFRYAQNMFRYAAKLESYVC